MAGLRSILRATSMVELLNSVGVDDFVSGYAFHSLVYTGLTLKQQYLAISDILLVFNSQPLF